MAMGLSPIMMLILLGGQVGNNLLEYVDCQVYWRMKGVEVSVTTMTAELTGPGDQATTPQVRSVRKLMAIQTLGELKNRASVPALHKLTKSKELFVADFAARAIRAIEGKPPAPRKLPAAARQSDLGLLPSNCSLVAQVWMPGGGGSLRKSLGDAQLPGGAPLDQALEQITKLVLPLAERIGNVRLDAVTLGLPGDIGGDSGFVTVVARGQYDLAAVKAALAPTDEEKSLVDGVEVLRPNREVALLLPSAQRLILLGGPRKVNLPLSEVISALKARKVGLQNTPEMRGLIRSVGVNHPLWAVVEISETYRQAEVLAPVKTITLVTRAIKGSAHFTLTAEGTDTQGIAEAVNVFEEGRNKAIQGIERAAGSPMEAMTKPMLELLQSIATQSQGKRVTVTAKAKEDMAALIAPLLFFSGVRSAGPPPAPNLPDENF